MKILPPRMAINKAFLKVKPTRLEIDKFKANLLELLEQINSSESEEFHKNLVSNFLNKSGYESNHYINTKGRNDLVVYNGNTAKTTVGVIIEAKKPSNKAEMLKENNINVKAFQELVLYYLRERITHNNLEIKHLIATNINEWFIFDSNVFEKIFAENKGFVKQFNDFENGRLSGKTTDFFYQQIAKPFIDDLKKVIEFTHFDIRDYENEQDDKEIRALFKLISPQHLLKLPFANDSNSLDTKFYDELLHIIGLSERNDGGKKLIKRKKENDRNDGSLLENSIIELNLLDLGKYDNSNNLGETNEDRIFNIALELSITWINRILFLKLLEAQLKSYHKDDKSYEFLNINKIKNYADLNNLFFQILAKQQEERPQDSREKFAKVPYLNSSLFEPTDSEQKNLVVNNLDNNKTIPLYATTVLKNQHGKKQSGELNALDYLFEFLNAYDFSSEGSEAIQEDNKTLINAAVLGLIFEKINGYKDGSFFTPGFITMYMCRETIRRAVVNKFNETKKWKCKDIKSVHNKIDKDKIQEANHIINSLKICDPAVGSGHLLVSALNEIIAIKNELDILQDEDGKLLREYNFEVVNDELIVTNEDGELFEYHPKNSRSARVQKTLFNEKKTIIENCLFGVDINPNSVNICRLRLWIELLKNAYYKNDSELETLPNIDINIKCGNSLISRFALDVDLKKALKKSKRTIDEYKHAVSTYRNAQNKYEKQAMVELIENIKNNFSSEISTCAKERRMRNVLEGEILIMTNQTPTFKPSQAEQKGQDKTLEKLTKDYEKLDAEIEAIENNKIYENAFEWRFEFPEVLNDDGDFMGFDVMIGNPPYMGEKGNKEIFQAIKHANLGEFYQGKMDIFYFFFHLALNLGKKNTINTFITTSYYLTALGAKKLRYDLKNRATIQSLINFNELKIFKSASGQHNLISIFSKGYDDNIKAKNCITNRKDVVNSDIVNIIVSEEDKETDYYNPTQQSLYDGEENYIRLAGVGNVDDPMDVILEKIKKQGTVLGGKNGICNVNNGIVTGADKLSEKHISKFKINGNKGDGIFVLSDDEIENLIPKDERFICKKWFKNSDVNKYICSSNSEKNLLYINKVISASKIKGTITFLKKYQPILELRREVENGRKRWFDIQWERKHEIFEQPKIVAPQRSNTNTFGYNEIPWYAASDVFFITAKINSIIELKYILALLNSKLYYQWLYYRGKRKGKMLELTVTPLAEIPIKEISKTQQQPFIKLVDKILTVKKNDTDTSAEKQKGLEAKIDQLIYQLYDLTEAEIALIEDVPCGTKEKPAKTHP